MQQYVILIDENDVETGTEEKMTAHKKGLLHRAFSVLIYDNSGKMLLQKRAAMKYHSAGLWTNACCSHPEPGQDLTDAVKVRLHREMGFTTEVKKTFDFIYRKEFEDGITEHEYDHVFSGTWNGMPHPNPDEVADWKWMDIPEIKRAIAEQPEDYTYWFRIIMERF
jgi:isopentenyl-diphosphate Delta-isomerase